MFGKHNKDVHNNEVKAATVYLKQTIIPEYAALFTNTAHC